MLAAMVIVLGVAMVGTILAADSSQKSPTTQPAAKAPTPQPAVTTAATTQPATQPGAIRVGELIYGGGKTGVCFSDGFLATVARAAGIPLVRHFEPVKLGSDRLFDYPFVVMTGNEAFTLSKAERANLKRYIQQGGFILASAGCSSAAWANSFRKTMAALFGDHALTRVDTRHPLFHSLYDIDAVIVNKADVKSEIDMFAQDGMVRVLFSPLGLNDSIDAGGGCCCCGGSEIRNARLINANALAYALTH